jgi:hypothetical protein
LVGVAGELGFAGDVDAPEDDLPAVRVAELAIFDRETEVGHCPRPAQVSCAIEEVDVGRWWATQKL